MLKHESDSDSIQQSSPLFLLLKFYVMNFLDIVLIIPIIIGGWFGFKKGFIIAFFTLLALLVGLYAGIHFSDFVSNLISKNFNYHSHYLPVITFTLIFLLVGAMVYFAGKALEKVITIVALSPLNKVAGLLFGIIKYAVFTSTFLIVFDGYDKNNSIVPLKLKEESLLYNPIKNITASAIPTFQQTLINHSVDQVIH